MLPYYRDPKFLKRKRKLTPEEIEKENIALYVGIIAFVAVFFTALQWGDPVDDAYVSFVYVKNLVAGHGMVFNIGERVEGYSNFLWVMLLWLGSFAFPIPDAAQIFGFLLGITNTALIYFVGKRSGLRRVSLLAAALYATDLSVSVWNVEGLETPLYSFFIILTLLLYMRGGSKGMWGLTALLAAMTRPEGAALFGAMVMYLLWRFLRQKVGIKREDFIAAAIFMFCFGAYNVWRYFYFGGDILPNTFYARGGFGGPVWGTLYLAFSLWSGRPVGILLMFALVGWGIFQHLKRKKNKEEAVIHNGPVLAWAIVGVAVLLATGGDWMPNGRFLVPLLPVFYILCANGVKYFRRPVHYWTLTAVLVATNVFGQMSYGQGNSFEKRWSREQASFYMPVADWLKKHDARGKTVVLSDVGYITYYSEIRAIDTLGLTNKRLARVKGGAAWATDVNYVLDLKPDYIISMVRDYGNGAEVGHTAFDREAIKDDRFRTQYRGVAVIPGYDATERATTDFKVRSYKVTFHIYQRTAQ